jgi:hypothetical protein
MQWIAIVVAAPLLAQAPNEPAGHRYGAAAATQSPAPQRPDPRSTANLASRKLTSADLVEAFFSMPAADGAKTRPLTLAETLAAAHDRTSQVAAVLAYWKLSAAIATFHVAADDVRRQEQLMAKVTDPRAPVPGVNLLEWETRLAASRARSAEAHVQLVAAQFELAQRAHLSNEVLPVPADRPLVGPYNTYFTQIFHAGRAPDPEHRLLDKVLPLRHDAVELEAASVQAAADATEASRETAPHTLDQVSAATSAIDAMIERQLAFIESVRRYNDDIARYALPLATYDMSPGALASMLVKAPAGVPEHARAAANAPPTFQPVPEIAPATFNQPLGAAPAMPVPGAQHAPAMQNTPAMMSPPPGAKFGQPTLAPPRESFPPASSPSATPTKLEPSPTPAAGTGAASVHFGPHEARRDVFGREETEDQTGLYAALRQMPAARRAQELTRLLHRDRARSDKLGHPTTLVEAIEQSDGDRRATVAAYWQARRSSAQVHAAQLKLEQLEALAPVALQRRAVPHGAEDMLRLRLAKLAAQANVVNAKLELMTGQYELAMHMHRSLEEAWPMPSTAPHGGGYRLEPAATNRRAGANATRLERTIPGRHTSVSDRATSLVLADAARTEMQTAFGHGKATLSKVLGTIERQSLATEAFLDDVAGYNADIAEYVLTVAPAGTSPRDMASAMVLSVKR